MKIEAKQKESGNMKEKTDSKQKKRVSIFVVKSLYCVCTLKFVGFYYYDL